MRLTSEAVLNGAVSGAAAPIQKSAALWPQTQCQMVALCNVCARTHYSLWLAFSGADIEFDFVLMTNAYSQYPKDSCKQYLVLIEN